MMKKFTISIFLSMLIFIGIQQETSAEKIYPIDYEFTITFSQSVDLADFKQFVEVIDEYNNASFYKISYGEEENIVKLRPETNWEYDSSYSMIIHSEMPNQSKTQTLGKVTTFHFTTEKEPVVEYEKTLAPVSNQFINYAQENLLHKSFAKADAYYSNVLDESLIDRYNTFFEKHMYPYMSDLFPKIKEHNESPTFVFLGNEYEPSTMEFAQKFYSAGPMPFGWYTPSHNITVMTQRGYTSPYKTINTIVFRKLNLVLTHS